MNSHACDPICQVTLGTIAPMGAAVPLIALLLNPKRIHGRSN